MDLLSDEDGAELDRGYILELVNLVYSGDLGMLL